MSGYAFFDVDGTLIKLTSMIDFQTFAEASGIISPSVRQRIRKLMLARGKSILPREVLNAIYYNQFAGCSVAAVAEIGREWFSDVLGRDPGQVWNGALIERLHWHQDRDHRVVLVSGSFLPCLAPIAAHLGVSDILCAQPQQRDGRYTGRLIPPQTIGAGKAKAMESYLSAQGEVNKSDIWAYGDHVSDIPMLRQAAKPVALAGDQKLEEFARRSGWTVI